jgi:hypothetical protein
MKAAYQLFRFHPKSLIKKKFKIFLSSDRETTLHLYVVILPIEEFTLTSTATLFSLTQLIMQSICSIDLAEPEDLAKKEL